MQKLSLTDLPIQGKKVLMRVDFNVPLDDQGNISDDTRILASLPSIRYVLQNGGSLILMSHLGRPDGKKDPKLSLLPCAEKLKTLLPQTKVSMARDCIGSEVEKEVQDLPLGEILLLENLRFYTGEEKPNEDPGFVKALAQLGDLYINDAFGTAHRSHASTAVITQFFPGKAAAGFLLEKEIRFLGAALKTPIRPFHAIIGGAKISTKLGTLKALLEKADRLLIGGAMAFTFFKVQGLKIGKSLYEENYLDEARLLLQNPKIILPPDILIANAIKENANVNIINIQEGIPDSWSGVDIGPETILDYGKILKNSKTIFWNGPMGVFEIEKFAKGTKAIAAILAQLSAITIVGGGDSLAAVHKAGLADQMTHLSTGGGATLEYIEQGTLPGVEALSNRLS